ncbi:hypothetical protein H5410_025632 [Solanum commersonii]|uniref:Uncharacterized protein n=1 Tax=Solanum commersonii TaxID=4109 RepID=A0A9J5YYJ0_SOLCO|nr:hypothetical protein H5410_025632 [Solanum commersonii]
MNISILLRHLGSDARYKRYISDWIVVGKNISFINLISTIATELDIDELKKKTSRSDTFDEEIQNFDATTCAIVCVEGGKRNTKALRIIVESKIGNFYYIP